MTGLNKIIDKIISEAHDRARITVEQARRQCIEISNEYAQMREREKEALQVICSQADALQESAYGQQWYFYQDVK